MLCYYVVKCSSLIHPLNRLWAQNSGIVEESFNHEHYSFPRIILCDKRDRVSAFTKMAEKTWSIERFNGENWSTWKFQMKHLLLVKDLWNITQGTEQLSTTANEDAIAEFDTRSQKAFSMIVMSISPAQLYLITSCESAKDAWDNLKQQFESNTLQNKLLLKKQYFRAECRKVRRWKNT